MKKIALILLVVLIGVSCGSSRKSKSVAKEPYKPTLLNENTYLITDRTDDKTYGYTEKNPIKVGGSNVMEGPLNERRFLNAIAGPNGEQVRYRRLGSCCHFETPNGINGAGLLDRYSVIYDGLAEPIILYINMYDSEELFIPVGFSSRYEQKQILRNVNYTMTKL